MEKIHDPELIDLIKEVSVLTSKNKQLAETLKNKEKTIETLERDIKKLKLHSRYEYRCRGNF